MQGKKSSIETEKLNLSYSHLTLIPALLYSVHTAQVSASNVPNWDAQACWVQLTNLLIRCPRISLIFSCPGGRRRVLPLCAVESRRVETGRHCFHTTADVSFMGRTLEAGKTKFPVKIGNINGVTLNFPGSDASLQALCSPPHPCIHHFSLPQPLPIKPSPFLSLFQLN